MLPPESLVLKLASRPKTPSATEFKTAEAVKINKILKGTKIGQNSMILMINLMTITKKKDSINFPRALKTNRTSAGWIKREIILGLKKDHFGPKFLKKNAD